MKHTVIPKSYIIKTKNYTLRIPNLEDIPKVFSATRFAGFNDGMMWELPVDEGELIKPLRNNIKSWESGNGFSFTITLKEDSELLGRISIRKMREENTWDVGFWTHPESQGKGIMTEALDAVLRFGFEVLSATRIEACHAIWNVASKKVLENNGMQFVRFIEKGFKKKGKWVGENQLAINKEDWEI